jgi:hypothetical protein
MRIKGPFRQDKWGCETGLTNHPGPIGGLRMHSRPEPGQKRASDYAKETKIPVPGLRERMLNPEFAGIKEKEGISEGTPLVQPWEIETGTYTAKFRIALNYDRNKSAGKRSEIEFRNLSGRMRLHL